MLSNDPTRWWMLQIEFPEKHPGQGDLLSQPIPRQELLRRSFECIPSFPRILRGDASWGLADVQQVDENITVANLTVRPPTSSIAEESMPGVLEEANEPRFFTPVVLHLSLQILAVQRTPEVSRFARSAKTFALIIAEFLDEALRRFEMTSFYLLTVEAIAEKGSFLEWYSRLEHLDSLTVHYIGKNLPARPDGLIHSLRKAAEEFKNDMRSESVDLVAKNPSLTDQDVDEIDNAIAERRLKIRARGTRNGVGTPWSSKDKPVPRAVLVPFEEQEASSLTIMGSKIGRLLQQMFPGRQT
jgi:hypothetical protein